MSEIKAVNPPVVYVNQQGNMFPHPTPPLVIYQQSKVNTTGATVASLVVSNIVPSLALPITVFGIMPKIKKMGNFPLIENLAIKLGAKKALKESGLDKLGTHIEYLKPSLNKNPSFIEKYLSPIESVRHGNNAFFCTGNKILMPEKDLSFAVFHEIGHAMNHNFSKALKSIQLSRNLLLTIPSIIALFGTFTKNSKPEVGKELSKDEKTKNFIRDNAGKLAFLSMVPILFEEALATIKGQKLANKVLSPELARKVGKGNRFAYLTYLAQAVFSALGAYSAVKVKDSIIAKKEKQAGIA